MLFSWIRTRARNAVLAGLSDAVEVLEAAEADAGQAQGIDPLALLRARLTPALPAPDAAEGNGTTARGRKKTE